MRSVHWSGVTIDCIDPRRLGDFWSVLLGREPTESLPGWVRLGGRSMEERHDYDEGVVMVMADPEGNEFCLVQYSSPHKAANRPQSC